MTNSGRESNAVGTEPVLVVDQPAFGVWATLGSVPLVEGIAAAGVDWIGLDQQHGRFDDTRMLESIDRLRRSKALVLVRVRSLDFGLIGRALDAGADGVIVPMVSSAEDAFAAVAAARYPPLGARSWGPMFEGYETAVSTSERNASVVCAVMVETPAGLDKVEEIAATPGVDMVFVGPFDLALALGVDVDAMLADTSLTGILGRIVGACRAAGVTAGAFGGTPERASQLLRQGFTFVAAATDALSIQRGTATILDEVQSR